VAGALEGVRILDCTQIIAGPLAGSLLSEMGADVVKVEPIEGEPWRLQAEIVPKESKTYIAMNRGKRGLAINFKDGRAHAIRIKLIEWADVLLTNYRPGVPEALKIDYDSARGINPGIIYCESTAFGKEGPDAERRGYDIVAQAMSGLATTGANLRDGTLVPIPIAPADVMTGFAMAWAVSAALFHREKTGEGQRIDASLLLTALSLQGGFKEIEAFDVEPREHWLSTLRDLRTGGETIEGTLEEKRRTLPALAGNVYYRSYQTSDGYLSVGCLGPTPRARFRKAVSVRDPRYDADFDSTPDNLRVAGEQLVTECEAVFLTRTTEDWLKHLDAHDIAAGPVRFVEELWDDPQVAANDFVAEYEHSILGPMRAARPVVSMSGTPTRVQRASPALGEHNDEVLVSLGFAEDEIAKLRSQGTIR
jgi:crotonobetainyl-CoA:carnitine CoA-transferase CaiB-like acyl-CoA transferase